MSHSSTAKLVRLSKERHPEFYCPEPECLFRAQTALGYRPCPEHRDEGRCTSCGDPLNNADGPRCNGRYCAKDGEE